MSCAAAGGLRPVPTITEEWPAMPDNRRLVVTENITANGVIEFTDDWFDPADQDDVEDLFAVMHDQMAREEALLLGRKTFEEFRGCWPLQTDDASGSAAHLNRVPKYVASSTMTEPAWSNTTVLAGRLEDEVAALKADGDGGDLGVTGSVSVVHALIRAGLVDEYRLFVYPVLSSRGRNLMPAGQTPQGLTLTECTPFRSGIVLQIYSRP
jgi:dihydrofolate reductase